MKKFIGTVLFICLTVTAFAQQRGKLTMSVIDAQTREGIAGAVVHTIHGVVGILLATER